jgi:hypothetical protein
MPQFVIERDIPGAGAMSEQQARDTAQKSLDVLGDLGPDIQWLHSFVTDDKIYCVYYSPDEGLIRKHAETMGIPANRVEAVRRLLSPASAT